MAYTLALEKMNGIPWVDGCCKEACEALSSTGICAAKNASTLSRWAILFRDNKDKWPPNLGSSANKEKRDEAEAQEQQNKEQ
mmetsp:Transcript_30078/g.69387  ORF Transcript_30078/g.69387 Transcript_30078/m.69387 type:complete len:82 (-) Transcript_30078:1970-2215(-)